jgi:hypothetical protein
MSKFTTDVVVKDPITPEPLPTEEEMLLEKEKEKFRIKE